MNALSNTVEEIILRHDPRGMTRIRKRLESGYCQRATRLILDNRGVILIGTGFPVAGSFESDGPIGAIAFGEDGFPIAVSVSMINQLRNLI